MRDSWGQNFRTKH